MDIYTTLINQAVYAPFVGALIILFLWQFAGGKSASLVALLATGVSCVSSVWLWLAFWLNFSDSSQFAFSSKPLADCLPALALNGISAPLFALAGIVGFAATMWAAVSDIERKKLYIILLLTMQGGLMGVFGSINVLWIYIFHEFALVPTFVAMCIWGGFGKRMAAMQMAVYLTLGALVSLVGIIALYSQSNAVGFSLYDFSEALTKTRIAANWQYYIFALLMFGLGTLVSLFPFYTWAPRGYAAAPTSFAMLHAGVLKKFGLYLLIQFAIPFLPQGAVDWSFTLAVLALFNVLYLGLVTMAQNDLKLMVAYSSVSHMGMCFLGIAAMSVVGIGGTVLLMFAHGLSAALLFMLSNAVVNKTGEWNMRKMGGFYQKTPVLAGMFIAATFASLGLPGFANFFGELSIFVALWTYSPAICALAALGLIISAIYGLRAVAWIFMGKINPEISSRGEEISDLTWAQRVPAILLLAALIFAGVCPSSVTSGLDSYLSNVPVYNQNK